MSPPAERPLTGLRIGISISKGDDLEKHGFAEEDIPLVTIELCRRFVGLGAQVVLGHQWRPKGIMDQVVRLARAYQWEASSKKTPIVHNFLAWPNKAALSDADLKELGSLVKIQEFSEPKEVSPDLKRCEGYTRMRQEMAKVCDARICLSGKSQQPKDFGSLGFWRKPP